MRGDELKIVLAAASGALLLGGAMFLADRYRKQLVQQQNQTAGALTTIPGLTTASSLNTATYGPVSRGSAAGSAVTGQSYVLVFTTSSTTALGADWRLALANTLAYLGWLVRGQVANDAIDLGKTDTAATTTFTAIAVWQPQSGTVFNSNDSPPVTYQQMIPAAQLGQAA